MISREEARAARDTGEIHDQLVHDLQLLRGSRMKLTERLERVVVALALTLDAESAAEQRLRQLQDDAGARRLGSRSGDDGGTLAQRYRSVIRTLETIHEECTDPERSLS